MVGDSLRTARRAAGLSQRTVARRAGMTQMQVSRIERSEVGAGIRVLATLAAIVGLDLVVTLCPGGAPVRDVAHARLLARLQKSLTGERGMGGWRTEVPIPIPGDQRAVDAELRVAEGSVGFELETRLVDAQATVRRAALKQRDAGMACMVLVLVLADTRANRAAIVEAAATLRTAFPLEPRAMAAALRNGSLPPGNGFLLV
ncbi:MAG: helix-turn-helix domain-containing protein [Candidatus Limnocylindria bacterium]